MKIWKNLNQSITGLSITFLTCWSLLAKISSSVLLLPNQMEQYTLWWDTYMRLHWDLY
jgi:hypothetical protein